MALLTLERFRPGKLEWAVSWEGGVHRNLTKCDTKHHRENRI